MADQYKLGSVIGKGSYGEVTLATHKRDKRKFVIKTIDLHNANEKERIFAQQEVDILSKLRHPNIVSYKESFQTKEGYLAIVMGYCEGGDLYSRLKKQAKIGEYLSETQTVEWFVQIAMALQYMHDRNILHRDLKTQNVFLTKSKIIKLGDLGIARVLDNNVDMATTMIGTPYYMSPELFSNKPYNHKSDVWALGCCVYEMATLKHAFNAKDMNSLVYKILKGKTPAMPKHYSADLQDIIKAMLNYDPIQRPSASRILRHPFIKKHIALFLEGTKSRRRSREEKAKRVSSNDSGYSESSIEEKAIATASKIDIELESSNKVEKEQKQNIKCAENEEKTNSRKNVKNDQFVEYSQSTESKSPVKEKSKRIKKPPDPEAKVKEKPIETSEKNRIKQPGNKYEEIHGKPSKLASDKKSSEKIRARPLPPCPMKQDTPSALSHESQRKQRNESDKKISERKSGRTKGRLPPPRFQDEEKSSRKSENQDEPPHRKHSSGTANSAARRKRRERQQEIDSKIISPRVPGKKDSIISIVESHSPRPHNEIVRAHIQRMSYNRDSIDCTHSLDSVDGNANQSDCLDSVDGNAEEKDDNFIRSSSLDINERNGDEADELSSDHSIKNEDVENLIDNLQATLKLDSNRPDSGRSPEQSNEYADDSIVSATGRLNDRIFRLRKECTDALGEKILLKAYEIIDNQPERKIESSLISLLGRKNFDLYGGQIWQLKFCEEFKV